MPEFLELLSPGKALDVLLTHLPPVNLGSELVDLMDALGRVTAKPVIAVESLPAFPRSTVDGYAVRARDTFG
ncbi:MAG: molybdopterin molybdenumtransferase MoeA, partial [Anaerolineales bacterium]